MDKFTWTTLKKKKSKKKNKKQNMKQTLKKEKEIWNSDNNVITISVTDS